MGPRGPESASSRLSPRLTPCGEWWDQRTSGERPAKAFRDYRKTRGIESLHRRPRLSFPDPGAGSRRLLGGALQDAALLSRRRKRVVLRARGCLLLVPPP